MPLSAFAQTPPPTCSISATPTSVLVGSTVTVRWSSTYADAGTITRIGAVGSAGQLNIQPSAAGELVFAGTFTGAGGTATCQTSIVVSRVTTGGSNTSSGGSGATYNSSYTTGSYSTGDPYSINPANYQTQPSSNQFAGNQQTVSPGPGGGVASFLVPCGWSSSVSRDNGPDNIPADAVSCNICYFGQLIQNIINFLIIISIPLSAALFAWAGIMLFTSTYKPTGIAKAKGIFRNVVIGLVIALSGYLIVQTLLNALMNQAFFTNGWSWSSLSCTDNRPRANNVGDIFTNLFLPSGTAVTPVGTATTPTGAAGSRGTTVCTTANCSTDTIAAAAQQAGLNLSPATVSALSCIAQTENSGAAAGCSNQNACGVFQITQGNWNTYAPANCRGVANQSNAACNVATAMIMFKQSGYQPWTGVCRTATGCGNVGYNQQWNPAATTCVNTFDGNTSYKR